MSLSPDNSHLAVSGTALQVNGNTRPRLALIDTGGSLGVAGRLSGWTAPVLANNCKADMTTFAASTSLRTARSSSPHHRHLGDGSTPYSVCDALARFNVNAANTTEHRQDDQRRTRRGSTTPAGTPSTRSPSPAMSSTPEATSAGSTTTAAPMQSAGRTPSSSTGSPPSTPTLASASPGGTRSAPGRRHDVPGTFPANTYDGTKAGLVMGTDVDTSPGLPQRGSALPDLPGLLADPRRADPIRDLRRGGRDQHRAPRCASTTPADASTSGAPVEL